MFRAIVSKQTGADEWEEYGLIYDGPHEVARWLADMAKKVKREAALVDHAVIMKDQPDLWGANAE